MARCWAGRLLAFGILALAPVAQGAIANTVHNLTATGPGTIKARGVGELCIFCHTPHSATQTRALWNQALPGTSYKLYTSSTLEATLNQPTGASRLCLSCHDGTLALGSLRVPPRSGLVTLPPLTGRSSLGADLSDDHPVSFVYDSALAIKRGELTDPALLPKSIRLDDTKQLQCSACHDPHDDRYRKFLRMDDRSAGLCTTCHRQRNWSGSTHATSIASWRGAGTNPWPDSPYNSLAENGCQNCHRPHSAPHPPRLLSSTQEGDVCLVCHKGTVASKNMEQEFLKNSVHPVSSTDWTHEPRENPNTMPRHATCPDCHNPHRIRSYRDLPAEARVAVCARCHRNYIERHAWLPNTRLHFGYLECATCHSPGSQKSMVYYFAEKTESGKASLSYGRLKAALGADPGAFVKGDDRRDADARIGRLFTVLRKQDTNAIIDASIIVTKVHHDYSETPDKEKGCLPCHSREAAFYDSMFFALPEKGSTDYVSVKGTLFSSYPIGTFVDIFLLGEDKLTKVDFRTFLGLKGPRLTQLGFKLIDFLGMLLMVLALAAMAAHVVLRIVKRR